LNGWSAGGPEFKTQFVGLFKISLCSPSTKWLLNSLGDGEGGKDNWHTTLVTPLLVLQQLLPPAGH